jgi:hypothetical protein
MRTAIENALFYGQKKSEQNMKVALEACTKDFTLFSPPFGANMNGVEENLRGMGLFFQIFPDYNVIAEHTLMGENFVAMTGKVQMTPDFSYLKLAGKGKKATIDFSAAFDLRGSLLLKEIFLLDIVDLCKQSGLPLEVALQVFKRS